MTYFKPNSKNILVIIILISLALFMFNGCSSDVTTSTTSPDDTTDQNWLIPEDEVFGGGPGKDGIPALLNPPLTETAQITFLNDRELIIGIKIGNEIRGYPHQILDWHEIINDQIGQSNFAVTYCPLTGSAIGWNRNINGSITTFGVSGLLYNTNLIPYDRLTNSNWSQMKLQSVNGSLKGDFIKTVPLIETNWETFKTMFPQTKIINRSTGYSRSYGRYPYGDYKTNNSRLLFPVNNNDNRIDGKERVLGVTINNQHRAYRFINFTDNTKIITDNLNGAELIIVGNKLKNFIAAYKSRLSDGTILTFSPVQDLSNAVMEDNLGTRYDLFGFGISGPGKGQQLEMPEISYIAYWFAWAAFNPGTSIF